MRRRLASFALMLGLVVTAVPVFVQSSAFTLAVVRRDGVLVPFVTFTGTKFERHWPTPERHTDVPAALDAVPSGWWPDKRPQIEWRFQPLEGETHSLEVKSPIWVPVQCQQQTALLTDYQTAEPPPPPDVQPYPKDGLAWTGTATIEPIDILTSEHPVWQRLGRELASTITKHEQEAIERAERSGWRHPLAKEARERTSATLEAVYGALTGSTQGGRAYYVEATKRYKRKPGDRDADCDIVSFVHGWVRVDKGGKVLAARMGGNVTACDYHSVAIMHPLAVLRLNAKPLWVVQWSTWGKEQYEIIDPTAGKLLFETTAGQCSG
ncbi:MAG: hypothetical protein GEV06_12520 [Luteitalea sp.]|nr:hypothetical protein [Luteitalea sp.]